jgi:phosphatidylglycerophosphatase A
MSRYPSRNIDRAAAIVASFAWSGFFPVAPATFASAVTTLILALVYPLGALATALLVVAILLLGVWACGRVERFWGHDPGAAVIDEVCGMAVTLAMVPITPATLVLGFLLFRFFDILKIPPGAAVERLPGGWGVMLDDVVAGLYAALGLHLLLRVWPEPRFVAWHAVVFLVLALAGILLRKPLMRRYAKPHMRPPDAKGKS